MSLVGVAKETLSIIEQGFYLAPSGARVELGAAVAAAVRGTVLYRPAELEALFAARLRAAAAEPAPPRIEVSGETTSEGARRLTAEEGGRRVALLNFASAKNPGGGVLRGAKAQEEDLSRASALYSCLVGQREYYDANRAHRSLLYTDHLIYSPAVPFFRDPELALLEQLFRASVLTAPAPNAGEALRRDPACGPAIRATLEARAAKVLAVAAGHGERLLVLGAWGCGVFRNDPRAVAEIFGAWLSHPAFAAAFDRVLFAIYDRSRAQDTRRAFEERFSR